MVEWCQGVGWSVMESRPSVRVATGNSSGTGEIPDINHQRLGAPRNAFDRTPGTNKSPHIAGTCGDQTKLLQSFIRKLGNHGTDRFQHSGLSVRLPLQLIGLFDRQRQLKPVIGPLQSGDGGFLPFE